MSKPLPARLVKARVRLCWRFKTVAMGSCNHAPGDITSLLGGQRSQGRRMSEERWWKSVGCTARFVAEPL
jgi:hypothetical protein